MSRVMKSRRARLALLLTLVIAVGATGTAIALKGKSSTPGKATHTVAGRKYVTVSADAVDGLQFTAKCPKGTHVVGGGAGADSAGGDVNESRPWDSQDKGGVPDDGWAAFFNDTSGSAGVRVYAICE